MRDLILIVKLCLFFLEWFEPIALGLELTSTLSSTVNYSTDASAFIKNTIIEFH
jgi:hypothetical protein